MFWEEFDSNRDYVRNLLLIYSTWIEAEGLYSSPMTSWVHVHNLYWCWFSGFYQFCNCSTLLLNINCTTITKKTDRQQQHWEVFKCSIGFHARGWQCSIAYFTLAWRDGWRCIKCKQLVRRPYNHPVILMLTTYSIFPRWSSQSWINE